MRGWSAKLPYQRTNVETRLHGEAGRSTVAVAVCMPSELACMRRLARAVSGIASVSGTVVSSRTARTAYTVRIPAALSGDSSRARTMKAAQIRSDDAAAPNRPEHAAADQHVHIRREAAQQRTEREQEHAHQKDAHATE